MQKQTETLFDGKLVLEASRRHAAAIKLPAPKCAQKLLSGKETVG